MHEAPTFEHSAPAETYAGMDLNLSVFVSDNVSVTSVQLMYKVGDDWTTVDATRKSGDYKSGDYRGEQFQVKTSQVLHSHTNGLLMTTETTRLKVTSMSVDVKAGITTGYFENFDASYAPIGWYSMGANDAWQWGAPTSGPGEAYSGENVYATNLAGIYNSSMNATLVMPPVDLPEGPSFLQFKHWHNFEESSAGRAWDYGHVVDFHRWCELDRRSNVPRLIRWLVNNRN